MRQRQKDLTIFVTLLILFLFTWAILVNMQNNTLEFPHKKASWFSLRNNDEKIAEFGTKNFDIFTNMNKDKFVSFIVFSQGNICKVIETSFNAEDYSRFRDIPFIRQVIEIPTMSTNGKDFCKNKSNSHFILTSMKNLKTIKKEYKRFNSEQEIKEFIMISNSKKSSKELSEEVVIYEVLQMKLEQANKSFL